MTEMRQNESIHDWALRLYANAKEYGIDCEEIGQLLNAKTGTDKTESAWRKYYKAFREGIDYERNSKLRAVKERILVLSDFHYPFNKPIETFSAYKDRTDTLVLNGDLMDCTSISKFSKSFRINPLEEMIGTRQYLIDLIEYLKPKKVVATYGNHELRLGAYLAKNLNNELQELMPETALDYLFEDGFTYYDRRNRVKVRYTPITEVFPEVEIVYSHSWWYQDPKTGIVFCHPKAFSTQPMKTAERAMGFFRNEGLVFDTLVMAHTHRLGSYKIGKTMLYEQGCCCDTKKMSYSDGLLVNEQKEGFLYLCADEDGHIVSDATELVALN